MQRYEHFSPAPPAIGLHSPTQGEQPLGVTIR
jgi:hypothetical protein